VRDLSLVLGGGGGWWGAGGGVLRWVGGCGVGGGGVFQKAVPPPLSFRRSFLIPLFPPPLENSPPFFLTVVKERSEIFPSARSPLPPSPFDGNAIFPLFFLINRIEYTFSFVVVRELYSR